MQRVCLIRVFKDDSEFIPAVSADHIAFSDGLQDDRGDVSDDFVTQLMTAGIVELLEAVDVEDQQA